MKLNKLWDGLKRIANGDYVLEGDLISEWCPLNAERRKEDEGKCQK